MPQFRLDDRQDIIGMPLVTYTHCRLKSGAVPDADSPGGFGIELFSGISRIAGVREDLGPASTPGLKSSDPFAHGILASGGLLDCYSVSEVSGSHRIPPPDV